MVFTGKGGIFLFLPRVGARYIVPSSRDHHTYLPPIAPLGKIGSCRGHLLRWPFRSAGGIPALSFKNPYWENVRPNFRPPLALSFFRSDPVGASQHENVLRLAPSALSVLFPLCPLCNNFPTLQLLTPNGKRPTHTRTRPAQSRKTLSRREYLSDPLPLHPPSQQKNGKP